MCMERHPTWYSHCDLLFLSCSIWSHERKSLFHCPFFHDPPFSGAQKDITLPHFPPPPLPPPWVVFCRVLKVAYFFLTDPKWIAGMLWPRGTNHPHYLLNPAVLQPLHRRRGYTTATRHRYQQGFTVISLKAPSPEPRLQFLRWLSWKMGQWGWGWHSLWTKRAWWAPPLV